MGEAPLILVLGAADTGRAPLAAAMLRPLLAGRARVESAGVLGHDDDPPTGEAVATADQLGLDIGEHRARTLTPELAAAAALLIAIDRGVTRVVEARLPDVLARTHVLGELAGRERDIPDPFKMQLGAWLIYARELRQLIEAALPRLAALLPAPPAEAPAPPAAAVPAARREALDGIAPLLAVLAATPGIVAWDGARARVEQVLGLVATLPADPADLVAPYVGLLRAALQLSASPPTPGQVAALGEAIGRLQAPVGAAELAWLSARLGGWRER